MTSSPFLRNRQKKLAAIAGNATVPAAIAAVPDESTPAGQEYAALRVLLHDNLRSLKDIDSHELRIPKKQEFAMAFLDWISGVLEADQPVQDEILLINMIWALDYRDVDLAIELAGFAIRHGLTMPEPFSRSVACWLREDVAEVALAEPDTITHAQLLQVDALTADADMPDPAKAKLNKALGASWAKKAAEFDPNDENAPAGGPASYAEQALENYQRALKLDEKSGVKTAIKATEKLLKQLSAAPD